MQADLTIAQLRTAKGKMERAIEEAATKALTEFRQETGLSPEQVRIVLGRIDRVGSTPANVVMRVESELDLNL